MGEDLPESVRPAALARNSSTKKKGPIANSVDCTQQSWGGVYTNMGKSKGSQRHADIEREVQRYFEDAAWSLSHDVPLLGDAQSRNQTYQLSKIHQEKCKPP